MPSTKPATWRKLKALAAEQGVALTSSWRTPESAMRAEIAKIRRDAALKRFRGLVRKVIADNRRQVRLTIKYQAIDIVAYEWSGLGFGRTEIASSEPALEWEGPLSQLATDDGKLQVATVLLLKEVSRMAGRNILGVSGSDYGYFRRGEVGPQLINPDLELADFTLDDEAKGGERYEMIVRDGDAPAIIGTIPQLEGFQNECGINAIVQGLKGVRGFLNLTREAIYGWMKSHGATVSGDGANIRARHVLQWLAERHVSVYEVNVLRELQRYTPATKNVRRARSIGVAFLDGHVYVLTKAALNELIDAGRVFKRAEPSPMGTTFQHSNLEFESQVVDELVTGSTQKNISIGALLSDRGVETKNLCGMVYRLYARSKRMVENIRHSGGQIQAFQYNSTWVSYNPDMKALLQLSEVLKGTKLGRELCADGALIDTSMSSIADGLYDGIVGRPVVKSFMNREAEQFVCLNPTRALRVGDTLGAHGCAVDIARCYTNELMKRQMAWPIYSPRDEPSRYRGGPIQVGGYRLRPGADTAGLKIDGYVDCEAAKAMLDLGIISEEDIQWYIKPTAYLGAGKPRKFVQGIYALPIPSALKKRLINTWIGNLGQTHRNSQATGLATSDEVVKRWHNSECVGWLNLAPKLDDGGGPVPPLYMISRRTRTALLEHSLPMHQGIVQMANIRVMQLAKKVEADFPEAKLAAIRTDAAYFNGLEQERLNSWIETVNKATADENPFGIGQLRPERYKQKLAKPNRRFQWKPDKHVLDWQLPLEEVKVVGKTFDQPTVDKMVAGDTGFKLVAHYAGGGKTYHLGNRVVHAITRAGKSYTAHSSSNRAVAELMHAGVSRASTIASFVFKRDHETFLEYMTRLCKSDYIILDEYNLEGYVNMMLFYKLHRMGVKFIFAGADNQLPSIDHTYGSMRYGPLRFFREMHGGAVLKLTGSFRLNQTQMEAHDNAEMGFVETAHYAQMSPDEKEQPLYHLCYTNPKRRELNDMMAERMLKDKVGYEVRLNPDGGRVKYTICEGMPMLCKTNTLKNKGICNNIRLIIAKVHTTDGELTAVDCVTENGKGVSLLARELRSLRLGFAFTTHSVEGATLDEPVAISEIEKFTPSMALVALSRNRDNAKVVINNQWWGAAAVHVLRREQATRWQPMDADGLNKERCGLYESWQGDTVRAVFLGDEIKVAEGWVPVSMREALAGCESRLIKLVYGRAESARALRKRVGHHMANGIDVLNACGVAVKLMNSEVVKFADPEEQKADDARGCIYLDKKASRMVLDYWVGGKKRSKYFRFKPGEQAVAMRRAKLAQKKVYGIHVEPVLKQPVFKVSVVNNRVRYRVSWWTWADDSRTKTEAHHKDFKQTKKRSDEQAKALAEDWLLKVSATCHSKRMMGGDINQGDTKRSKTDITE